MTLLRAGLLVGAAATLSSCTRTPPPPPPPPPSPVKTVATTKQIMIAITTPSNALFNIGAEPPASDETWAALQAHAVLVAEAGNLLLVGERLKDHDDWVNFSRAMIDAGAASLKAVEAKDVDAASQAGDTLLETCSQCHEKYSK